MTPTGATQGHREVERPEQAGRGRGREDTKGEAVGLGQLFQACQKNSNEEIRRTRMTEEKQMQGIQLIFGFVCKTGS